MTPERLVLGQTGSGAQSQMGQTVSRDQLHPGDLVFFYSPVSHAGS